MDKAILRLRLDRSALWINLVHEIGGRTFTFQREHAVDKINVIFARYRGLFASSLHGAGEGRVFHDNAESIGRYLHHLIFEGFEQIGFTPTQLMVVQDNIFLPTELSFDGDNFLCMKVQVGNKLLISSEPEKAPFETIHSPKDYPSTTVKEHSSAALLVGYDGGDIDKVFNSDPLSCTRVTDTSREGVRWMMSNHNWPIVHLAGHGYFAGHGFEDSGLLVRGHQRPSSRSTVSIHEIARPQALQNSLVFLNACRAGDLMGEPAQLEVAREFMGAGARCFVTGTTPLSDRGAEVFAAEFYQQMLSGVCIGEALLRARHSLVSKGDWMTALSYVLFGDPDTKLEDSKWTGTVDNDSETGRSYSTAISQY